MSNIEGAEIPTTLDRGRYRIERVIGQGGTSVVLLATDTRLGVPRAIKLMNPRWARSERNRTRFRTEAFAQAGLQHTNVLMVHDAVEDEQGAYLVMELAEADSVTISSHKLGGPAGVGALCVARGAEPAPLIRGASQERGWRAGTHNVVGIVGLGAAAGIGAGVQAEAMWRARQAGSQQPSRMATGRGRRRAVIGSDQPSHRRCT